MFKVTEVTASAFDDFLGVRARIRGQNPVADHQEQLELGPENLFFTHGEAQAFVCYRNGAPVGRIVASTDARHPDPCMGYFGYFECINNADAARQLLSVTEAWLTARNKPRVHGPINLSIFRAYRLQTHGFDTEAFVGEPRNPSYYPQLLRAAGYEEAASWSSWNVPRLKLLAWRLIHSFKHHKVNQLRLEGYKLVPIRVDSLNDQLRRLHPLLMSIFSRNYGFAPIDADEYVQLSQGLKDVAGMRPLFVLDPKDELIGFSLGFVEGRRAILHTFGIAAEHRGKGLPYLIFDHAMGVMKHERVTAAVGALVKSGPSYYARLGNAQRTYAIFTKKRDD